MRKFIMMKINAALIASTSLKMAKCKLEIRKKLMFAISKATGELTPRNEILKVAEEFDGVFHDSSVQPPN